MQIGDGKELSMVFQFEHVDWRGKYGKWTHKNATLIPRVMTNGRRS